MIRVCLASALLCAMPCVSSAQVVLTFDDVISRARAESAAIAGARVAEAEALGAGAGRLQHNPVLDVLVGPRRTGLDRTLNRAGSTTADIDVGFSQQLEVSGQRGARVEAAAAGVARATALAAETTRELVLRSAQAFLRAVAAAERVRLAEDAGAVNRELQTATERRFAAGDVAAIDVNLARVETARSAGALGAARAALLEAMGDLRVLLRIPAGDISVRGSLDVQPLPPLTAMRESALRESALARPEFAVLEAEMRAADAQLRLARALGRPDLGVRAGYSRDDADTVVMGGLTVTLPAFQRGQSATALATAQRFRARLELERGREAALAQLESAAAAHALHLAAAAALASPALPALADNDTLARRSYDAGELNLIELLRIRRDAVETRQAIVDLRLGAALSRLTVDHLSGGLR